MSGVTLGWHRVAEMPSEIVGADGTLIAIVLASCHAGQTWKIENANMPHIPEAEANARLIASAPDLLEHGEFLADRLDEFERDLLGDEVGRQFHGHVAPALARLRAAIARARGEV